MVAEEANFKTPNFDKKEYLYKDEYLDYLAFAVNNLRMCYDCDVIIGGTVGSHMERYIEDLRNKASQLIVI